MTIENRTVDVPEVSGLPQLINTDVPATKTNNLTKLTLMDMSVDQVERVKNLAQMLSLSAQSNNGKLKQGDFFLMILKGLELGFSPMAAVDNISIIFGVPTVDGKGMLALVYASGLLKSINIEASDSVCQIEVERTDMEGRFSYSFSIEDAKKMGLTAKNKQYEQQPKVMLKWRAVANLFREAFPDVLGGVYTSEEIAPEMIVVDETGGMKMLPEAQNRSPQATNETPQQSITNAGNSSKDQSPPTGPQIVPKTAGESFLKDATGKNKLKQWLNERELQASENQALLKILGVSGFGEVKESDEAMFYVKLEAAYTRYVGLDAPQPEAETKAEEAFTMTTEVLEYDGNAIVVNGFDGQTSIKVKCFSRTTFAELAGKEWSAGYGITDLKPGDVIEVDNLQIAYVIKTTKTASKKKYGVITGVKVLEPETAGDSFEDFFPEKAES